MKTSSALVYLSAVVALTAAVYAGVGLFSQGGSGPFTFTTLHGDTVEMYGRGIYHNDSAFKAPILRGTDAVTLFVGVPALLLALAWYRRGSLRGRLFLAGVLGYFLYNSASLALGAAYNSLLLVYITCFSASLFSLVMAVGSVDLPTLAAHTSARLPRRLIAGFLFLAGLSVLVWLADIVTALAGRTVPPHLGPYTTEVTYLFDLGVILPTAYLAGVLVLRSSAMGTLLASILITLNASIGLVVAAQSAMQALEGIILTPGQYAAYVAPFATLSLIAAGLLVTILRHVSEPSVDEQAPA